MSLTEIARRVTIVPGVRNRILILDVERLDGITQQHYWDRGDLKNRYVHYETVIRHPRTTVFCSKWHDSDEVTRLAEWDEGGRPEFLRKVHAILSEADILIGHNIDNADVPWLRGDLFLEGGLPPLPPFKTVDTLKVLRREFKSGAPFKSLDAFTQIVKLADTKTDHYDRHAMERAVTEGSVEDRERLVEYCAGDVIATQGLVDYLRPHIRNHPALFVDGESRMNVCNRCGSSETLPTGKRYVANVLTYTLLRCANCKGYRRLSIEPERMSLVRGV
ncbi:hypothetical protein [Nocardioides aurantiacus]|uniref:DNA polymerase-3 subunit epsilon n=1 Tax=Nocardioides aurantiacus TaxID=86796 RepID=A0A3N2CW33_9ACTN|nr:hypothetical protein [Nocardioides aurantiacus]ROR91751.1 hypothetical protein EDD33_2626 [Nocardioides aurantiacus]